MLRDSRLIFSSCSVKPLELLIGKSRQVSVPDKLGRIEHPQFFAEQLKQAVGGRPLLILLGL